MKRTVYIPFHVAAGLLAKLRPDEEITSIVSAKKAGVKLLKVTVAPHKPLMGDLRIVK